MARLIVVVFASLVNAREYTFARRGPRTENGDAVLSVAVSGRCAPKLSSLRYNRVMEGWRSDVKAFGLAEDSIIVVRFKASAGTRCYAHLTLTSAEHGDVAQALQVSTDPIYALLAIVSSWSGSVT